MRLPFFRERNTSYERLSDRSSGLGYLRDLLEEGMASITSASETSFMSFATHDFLQYHVRRRMITGLLLLGPILGTFVLLYFLFSKIQGLVSPLDNFWGQLFPTIKDTSIPPMLSFAFFFLVLFFLGAFLQSALGRWGKNVVDFIFSKVPLAGKIYKGIREPLEVFQARANDKLAVTTEYPRRGIRIVAFQTGETFKEIQDSDERFLQNIAVHTNPDPTFGMVIMVPKADLVRLDMNVKEVFSLTTPVGLAAELVEKRVKARMDKETVDSPVPGSPDSVSSPSPSPAVDASSVKTPQGQKKVEGEISFEALKEKYESPGVSENIMEKLSPEGWSELTRRELALEAVEYASADARWKAMRTTKRRIDHREHVLRRRLRAEHRRFKRRSSLPGIPPSPSAK